MALCKRSKLARVLHVIIMLIVLNTTETGGDGGDEPPAAALRLLVPLRVNFQEFVYSPDNATFSGFCIDVFQRCALQTHMPPFRFVGFGDGLTPPNYTTMITKVQTEEFDGAIADITITAERMTIVDFTHPYMQSTLVMIQRYGWEGIIGLWTFLKPFSKELWICIGGTFFATGLVLSIVEHGKGDFEHQQANKKGFSYFVKWTISFVTGVEMSSRLGKTITMFWLVLILVLTSSYTASLTSLLTTENPKHMPTFEYLRRSTSQFGIQRSSFVKTYVENNLHVQPHRLIPIKSNMEYDQALETRNVAALLVESPYAELFLKSNCTYIAKENQLAHFGGLGFVFQKNSSFTNSISQCIVSLQQNGQLQAIKHEWFGSTQCSAYSLGSNMPISTFGGLFFIASGLFCFSIIVRIFEFLQAGDCIKHHWRALKSCKSMRMNE
ncbi:hypothetical protein L7F22_002707 [Adiantum nelumboides]|nr:hypothetical protein [Adiantum nelumboides]